MSKQVILFSGGMDSLIGWKYVVTKLNAPLQMLFLKIETSYYVQEFLAATELALLLHQPLLYDFDLDWLGCYEWVEQKNRIPMRNVFLVMKAALWGFEKIWLIGQEGELAIPDKCVRFYEEFSEFLTWQMDDGKKYEVCTPFLNMDKVDMVAWWLQTNSSALLHKTWGCYSPREQAGRIVHCGNCGACFRRAVAFELNGILLPEQFAEHPLKSAIARDYAGRVGEYDEKRQRRIKEALS